LFDIRDEAILNNMSPDKFKFLCEQDPVFYFEIIKQAGITDKNKFLFADIHMGDMFDLLAIHNQKFHNEIHEVIMSRYDDDLLFQKKMDETFSNPPFFNDNLFTTINDDLIKDFGNCNSIDLFYLKLRGLKPLFNDSLYMVINDDLIKDFGNCNSIDLFYLKLRGLRVAGVEDATDLMKRYTLMDNFFFIYNNDVTYFSNYVFLFFFITLAVIAITVIYLLSLVVTYSLIDSNIEKISAYECGFIPFSESRIKFDIGFYIISLLFVIFDLELVFLFPWSVMFTKLNLFGFISMIFFCIILSIGFLYEWFSGVLDV
jgi:NADH-quinone oxidoreductase subunit A